MLRKVILLICINITLVNTLFAEMGNPPNVYIVIQDEGQKIENTSLRSYYGSVPGKVSNLAALLYGKTPLECGVVSDFDWRRKPVKSVSLADCYQKAGYHTAYFGTWGMGLGAPFDPASRGFNSFWRASGDQQKILEDVVFKGSGDLNEVIESMPNSKPWLCVVRCSDPLSEKVMTLITKSTGKKEAIVMTVTPNNVKVLAAHGYEGKLPQIDQKTVGDLYLSLVRLLGMKNQPVSDDVFYHQGNWPLTESPEKHRHRGSVVLSEDFALIDGLELFAIQSSKISDEPLDLEEYADQHQKLLSAHARWWQRASRAINNPRPFDVGLENETPVHLTAFDWRPSRILHQEDSEIASQPMVYEETLLATLRGLKDNEEYKLSFPAYSGSWSVAIRRPGRYKITARLLPDTGIKDEDQRLAKLQGGYAHIQLGSNKVTLQVMKGATSVSAFIDAEQGATNLECWFVGQLALERELGAFFVEIERTGEKKFDLKAKQQEEAARLNSQLQK